jgi:hypothetical protein
LGIHTPSRTFMAASSAFVVPRLCRPIAEVNAAPDIATAAETEPRRGPQRPGLRRPVK